MFGFKKCFLSFFMAFSVFFSSVAFTLPVYADENVTESVGENVSENSSEAMDELSPDVQMAGEFVTGILDLIDKHYMGDVTVEELVKGAVEGMAGKLDQYSAFLDSDEFDKMMKESENELVGLGVSYYEKYKDGYPQIVNIYEDSPAYRGGLLKNDVLISIDGVDVKDMTAAEISSMVSQKKGKTVKVVVDRAASRKDCFVLINDFIVPTVFVSKVDELIADVDKIKASKVRYIQISSFEEATGKEFAKTVEKLKKENVEGIIIDFRFNGGGVTQAAYEICETLVKEGPFLNIQTKNGNFTVDSEDKEVPFKNIVVLTNEATASASELVTAVLKDNGAVIVGSKTYGKGVTQAVIELLNLGALKMTTEEFFPMSGRKINEVGIVPDYDVEQIKVIQSNSENVDKDVETALKELGYDITTNEKKQEAIKLIQKKYEIKETGSIDYQTISAINGEIINNNYENDTVFEKAVEVIFSKL